MPAIPLQANQSWTNSLGQVISAGDKVIVVTENWKRVKVREGTFLGVNINGDGVVMVPDNVWDSKKLKYIKGTRRVTPTLQRIYAVK